MSEPELLPKKDGRWRSSLRHGHARHQTYSKDNNGHYEPGNCKWATPREQARNRRNKRLTFETATQVALLMLCGGKAAIVAKHFGISESLPREIVKGRCWPDALAEAKGRINDGA